MTLDKAIENRTLYLKSGKIPKSSDDYNATLLSIEALDLISSHRKGCYMDPRKLLPGETKEPHHPGLPLKGITVKVEPGGQKCSVQNAQNG